jgi:hypothetical protein
MKVFHCDHCQQLVFFENSRCVTCGATLAYVPDSRRMASLPPAGDDDGASGRRGFRLCQNYGTYEVCNWSVAADDANPLCRSCRLTRIIPDLSVPTGVMTWHRLEAAKRRLIVTLLALQLPIVDRTQDPNRGLAFDFKADLNDSDGPPMMTGHAEGVITINIAEADDAERERRRHNMREPYRTLVGHMRHESGHYFWDRLIEGTPALEGFRRLFGDEQHDYGDALAAHYASGPPDDWPSRFVSAYASAHPWEDWAETWAHYLHMMETLETAADSGLQLQPWRPDDPALTRLSPAVTLGHIPFERLLDRWFPVTYILNNLNRGLGLPDAYPFVLSTTAIEKLAFVHHVITRTAD